MTAALDAGQSDNAATVAALKAQVATLEEAQPVAPSEPSGMHNYAAALSQQIAEYAQIVEHAKKIAAQEATNAQEARAEAVAAQSRVADLERQLAHTPQVATQTQLAHSPLRHATPVDQSDELLQPSVIAHLEQEKKHMQVELGGKVKSGHFRLYSRAKHATVN